MYFWSSFIIWTKFVFNLQKIQNNIIPSYKLFEKHNIYVGRYSNNTREIIGNIVVNAKWWW